MDDVGINDVERKSLLCFMFLGFPVEASIGIEYSMELFHCKIHQRYQQLTISHALIPLDPHKYGRLASRIDPVARFPRHHPYRRQAAPEKADKPKRSLHIKAPSIEISRSVACKPLITV